MKPRKNQIAKGEWGRDQKANNLGQHIFTSSFSLALSFVSSFSSPLSLFSPKFSHFSLTFILCSHHSPSSSLPPSHLIPSPVPPASPSHHTTSWPPFSLLLLQIFLRSARMSLRGRDFHLRTSSWLRWSANAPTFALFPVF